MTTPATIERRATAPTIARDATLNPASWNAEARTIEVVWTTGARGARFDWESGEPIVEELATASANVRLGRLNAGAPVLDTHNRSSLGGQIGVVVPGSARMTGGQGVATLRLSDRAELAPVVADIAAGIIRNLSVGYTVHLWEVERQPGAPETWRAIDWEPTEISFVPVPFDAGAQVRAAGDRHPCTIRTLAAQETTMTDTTTETPTPTPTPSTFAVQPGGAAPFSAGERAATIPELRGYFDTVREMGHLDHADAANLVLNSAERGMSMAQVRAATMQLAADRQRAATGNLRFSSAVGTGETFANPAVRSRAIEDALYARMSGAAPSEAGREFMGMTMVQIAGSMIEAQGARNVRTMTPSDVLQAAAWNRVGSRAAFMHERSGPYHSTSDFPDLLIGAGNRYLLDAFQAAASPLKLIGRRRSAQDFRTISGLQLSGFGVLPKVLEGGEIKRSTFRERKETYSVETFAEIFGLSRQAIINDDLGAFGEPVRVLARAASETEATLLAQLIESNPIMGDGKQLFSPEHGNLAGVGSAPSPSSLSDARLAMRGQKDLDGVTPLATAPKFIIAGPAMETIIEEMATSANTIDPTGKLLIPNPFAGKLTPLVEPRFNGKAWHLFADPAASPVLEYAYLNDMEAPRIDTRDGWDMLGTEFRVYMDFGAGLVDHRGAYKNPGAAG